MFCQPPKLRSPPSALIHRAAVAPEEGMGERHGLSELMLFYKQTPFLAVPSCSTGNGRVQTRFSVAWCDPGWLLAVAFVV